MNRNKYVYPLIAVAVVILAVSYVCYGIYKNEISRITTEPAEISTVEDTVKTVGYVVRDENRQDDFGKNTSVLTGSSDGVYVANISDGSRVAHGDCVAMKFKSAKDAQLYNQILETESRIDYYKKLEKQSSINNSDLDTLDKRISGFVGEYVDVLDSGELERLPEYVTQLEKNITTRQISTGSKINFGKIIKKLEKKYNELYKKKPSVTEINTSYPGFFISNVDGYEGKTDYESVRDLSAKKIEKLISSKPDNVDKKAFGKIIGEFEWFIVCTVPSSVLSYISKGSYVPVIFDDEGSMRLKMKVVNITADKNSKVALILSSSDMNEKIAEMRTENITVVVKSYAGYKISSESLRKNENGELGVFVDFGGSAQFKKVSISYFGNNFAVVIPKDPTDEKVLTQLELHDSIIVKGRDLKDGKLLSQ
ncbi:MAG: hypothetical protein MJ177_05435 [Clostridia bacterium]|nr:hypothetical protein [Clostridia bacterium]